MKIDLSQLQINFPEKPTKVWDHSPRTIFYDYRAFGYFGERKIGYIVVSICPFMVNEEKDDFWFERKGRVWIPRPVAVFQRTERDCFGSGVNGKLLVLANEEVKKRYEMSLASSITFCVNRGGWKDEGFAERPAIRVWQKLEGQGLAYSKPYNKHPRWVMK